MFVAAFSLLALLGAQQADPSVAGLTPGEVVDAAPAAAWRPVDPDHLLLVDLADARRVAIELNRGFAPVHVANIQAMARAGYWTGGASVYRVQDNYVVQWGHRDDQPALPAGVTATPPAEYVRPVEGLAVRGFGLRDSYATAVGFVDSWPVALYADGSASLTHCYGTVGVGRNMSPDTGTGEELYAVIGHAPRHLDRNIAIVGRVIDGMAHFSALPRGSEVLGMYPKGEVAAPIASVRLASMLPPDARPAYEVLRSDSETFARYVAVRANRDDAFYDVSAGGVDVCNVQVPVRPAVARPDLKAGDGSPGGRGA
ncbi:peptidylprolyl isomerase [Sphingomicrobium astaxanthinifaciens]|uniref:peptidylprolyl isomerase n=1 Tax=Sphingomicrobium astaxanthinifaciens TaxID=1227949 RepID=UPI001FCAD07D|nr:peptidylprolyl isomerase [Sphingomicrobium astaxanthinifaciens]MCJ7420998.1 peptidylprolyl isomerase [Sphingomicrobium astaxanthinifaciens]